MVLEKTLESSSDCKEIKPIYPKENQPWIFIGRTDDAEAPILWPPDWYFWTEVLEKTLEGPLDCKEIKSVHPKGNQPWMLIGRTDNEAETPILWQPDAKNWPTWKDPDAGKDWRQEEKQTTEDEMAGWHHQLDGREFEWTPGVGDGQGGLACCNSWGRKESDTTE